VRRFASILFVVFACSVGGCTSVPDEPAEIVISPAQYEEAFDVVRDVLVDARFSLDRVDARSGVITTDAKPSSGLAMPWDEAQSTMHHEVNEMINRHARVVRVSFAPMGVARADRDRPGSQAAPTPAPPDLRTYEDGDVIARFEVVIERIHRPGWQVESESVAASTRWKDPALQARGMEPAYSVPISTDDGYARRLAARVRDRMGIAAAPAEAQADAHDGSTPVEDAPEMTPRVRDASDVNGVDDLGEPVGGAG